VDNFMVNGFEVRDSAGFDKDQFGTDLLNGDVGQLNYVIPDQCDDNAFNLGHWHRLGDHAGITASDCSGGQRAETMRRRTTRTTSS